MAIRFDVWAPKFRNALGQFTAVRDDVLERAAEFAEKRAKGYAPVLTGELRANIQGTTRGTGTGARVDRPRLFLSAPSKYAPIEFGSRRGHRAQRFLERAMEDALRKFEIDMLKEGKDLLIKGRTGHIGPRFSGRKIKIGGR